MVSNINLRHYDQEYPEDNNDKSRVYRWYMHFGGAVCFWCAVPFLVALFVVFMLPEIMKYGFGMERLPVEAGKHVFVSHNVVDGLESECKRAVKELLGRGEISPEAALGPLQNCRDIAHSTLRNHHKEKGQVSSSKTTSDEISEVITETVLRSSEIGF